MKKLFALVIALALAIPATAEDLDIKQYSYEQLALLDRVIQMEMIRRPEWKRVEIPVGVWIVGEDIPAGAYAIRSTPEGISGVTLWRVAKDQYDNNGLILNETVIYDETNLIGKVYFEDGNVFVVEGSPVYLCPPAGLGF